MDGIQVDIDLPKRREIYSNRHQNDREENVLNSQNDLNDENRQNDQNDQITNGTDINTSSSWFWNDASTKLLLDIYKCKKDLVSSRKIKTYKVLWKQIAQEMGHSNYPVTPLQVENKIKSLERSYKNMISNNKMTGRARKTCKYEA